MEKKDTLRSGGKEADKMLDEKARLYEEEIRYGDPLKQINCSNCKRARGRHPKPYR